MGNSALAGYALTRGFHRPQIEHGIIPIRNNIFIYDGAAGTPLNFRPFSMAHEIGHVLLDASHASISTELMNATVSSSNSVTASKRITDGPVGFDFIGADTSGSLNQITTMRLSEMLRDD